MHNKLIAPLPTKSDTVPLFFYIYQLLGHYIFIYSNVH